MSEAFECDELREKAKLLRGHADGLNAPYVIPSTKESMALTMLDSAGRMERAADTILELRDDLQRANEAVQDAEHDESMAWDRVRKAEAENAKLKRNLEILRDYGIEIVDAVAGGFEIYSKDHALADRLKWLLGRYHSAMRCMLETGTWPMDPEWLEEQMRELGVEVD